MTDGLAALLGPGRVITDPDLLASRAVDWTGRWRGAPVALVRPHDVEEVAAVVAWCGHHGVGLVPLGGNTGLVAGTTAPAGSLLLSLERLDELGPVDRAAGQVTAGAGVTLARLQAHVAGTGWAFGVDFGARDSCTVGGMVATNAGGMRVVRHGSMRAQVLGVEAVLGDATVVRSLDGLVKDNTGYHLAGLLCGSEGTLGVVTAARLRLVPEPPERLVVLAAVPDVGAAVELAARLRSTVDGLDALEVLLAGGLGLVCDELGLPRPLAGDPPVALLVEWAGAGEPPPSFFDVFDGLDTVAATDEPGRRRLWRYREDMALAIARVGVPHKLDVTLPLGRLGAFCDDVAGAVPPGGRLHLFGHLGDGNLHVNVTGIDPDDQALDEAVLRLVVSLGGSISAEHGVGRAKARWLHLQRSPEELAAMRAVKRALDPHGILNPGALLGQPVLTPIGRGAAARPSAPPGRPS